MIYFFSFWLQKEYNPYQIERLNKLEEIVLASSIVILLGGIVSKMSGGMDGPQQVAVSAIVLFAVSICAVIITYRTDVSNV